MAITPLTAPYKTFTFDGETSASFGVQILGEGTFNAPDRAVDMITIPGRSGQLAIDRGSFENVPLTYPAELIAGSVTDFATAISDFRNFLCSRKGYCRLTDDYNPDEYRMAVYREGLEADVKVLRAGKFDIKFDCKPQRFLTSGENVYTRTASGSISNPTQFEAKPLLVVTGIGNLTVNGVQIAIAKTPTTIDCEAMEAYNGTTSRNSDIVLTPNKFPVLKPGNNTITLGSGITKVEITPRWWRI